MVVEVSNYGNYCRPKTDLEILALQLWVSELQFPHVSHGKYFFLTQGGLQRGLNKRLYLNHLEI